MTTLAPTEATFVVASESAGVACREDARWRVAAVAERGRAAGTAYRMAAGDLPPSVVAYVDEAIVGEPLDAADEQAAIARRWTIER